MQGHNDEKALAGLGSEARLTTFALAALIFGIVGVSALWLLVIAGLAALWSLLIALVVRFCGARSRIPVDWRRSLVGDRLVDRVLKAKR